MIKPDKLLARQLQLQAEADEIADEMHLKQLLLTAGTPVKVGSAALGLMAWRDLDITVVCSKLSIDPISRIALKLMSNPQVRDLKFINDTGNWNIDPTYPDGYFLGITYESRIGNKWELDIWFIDEPEKQPDLYHIRTMPDRLTSEAIISILSIKTVWAQQREYGKEVKSFDIYTAVLDNNVRTPAEFNQWLRSRNNNTH
ncbi:MULTISPECIES: hypothetical protein [Gracilibacillus]|uniref:Uncharacterized protein n=1 Tax=Gracilibacillus dipsosauri TaxID=178340 RepID=A0A317L4K1_9BACI|nr:hypothetical protein [Gracilibacillus dipsosauri]PWU69910.1 hypothetical protein DLJ74_03000 [Gracilibacillus dipsosauri]